MIYRSTLIACAVTCLAGTALADVEVSFRDGAPKDRFTITNTGTCPTAPMTLAIDMSKSAGRLIFDVTAKGAGVEVFQPLEITDGLSYLRALPDVLDGQSELSLELASLPPGARVSFTIDVDDTIGQREITVNGSEISGSELIVRTGFSAAPGVFDETSAASVKTPGCLS